MDFTSTCITALILLVGGMLFRRLTVQQRGTQRKRPASPDMGKEQGGSFEHAASYVNEIRSSLSTKQRLRLYSYYKQAQSGDAPPSDTLSAWTSVVERTKHASWSRRRGLARHDAAAKYIQIVGEFKLEIEGGARVPSTPTTPSAVAHQPSPQGVPPPMTLGAEASGSAPAAAPGSTVELSMLRARVAELEAELERATQPRTAGYLHKYDAHAASWTGVSASASRWTRRFFVLGKDGALLYYRTETDATPRRRLALSNCVVVDEGTKRTKLRGSFRIFSLWTLGTLESERGPSSGALLRVSCADEAEAEHWIAALSEATGHPVQSAAPDGVGLSLGAASPATSSASAAANTTASTAGDAEGAAPALTIVPPNVEGGKAPLSVARQPSSSRRKPLDPNLFTASRPMHRSAKPSLLSGLASNYNTNSSPTDLSGFINLIFLLFFVINGAGVIENAKLQGLRLSLPAPPEAGVLPHRNRGALVGVLATAAVLCLPPLFTFLIERAAVRGALALPQTVEHGYRRLGVGWLHACNCAATLFAPCALVASGASVGGAGGGVLLLIVAVTLFLKLTSYAHVHHDLRLAEQESLELDVADLDGRLAKFASQVEDAGQHVHYPSNVTLGNLLYFVAAPTLCYQTEYPRTKHVRLGYLLSLSLRLVVLSSTLTAICIQYMLPLLDDASKAIVARDAFAASERLFKLAIPVTYCWVGGFYTFFHVWLNLLAEVLRFGDRTFYKDWWNATDFETYWRKWNMPVHCWIVRHAYFPLQRHFSRSKAKVGFLCFTLSAVLHEIVVAFPLRSFYMPLAFFGMMAQVPMLPISAYIHRTTRGTAFEQSGNFLFWLTFCFVGQPLCVISYYMWCSAPP